MGICAWVLAAPERTGLPADKMQISPRRPSPYTPLKSRILPPMSGGNTSSGWCSPRGNLGAYPVASLDGPKLLHRHLCLATRVCSERPPDGPHHGIGHVLVMVWSTAEGGMRVNNLEILLRHPLGSGRVGKWWWGQLHQVQFLELGVDEV